MLIWEAIVLGIVEGLTEFLPISSTGHLTVAEKLLGFDVDDEAITGFTAVIQVGAIAAVVVYLWPDIARVTKGWFAGVRHAERRGDFDYRFGWVVVVGSIPIGIVGVAAREVITGPLRNLWWVAGALIGWSAVVVVAERVARQDRRERDIGLLDGFFVGILQCFSLVPGVSRSAATISAGLFRGLDRVAATRLAFFLAIPAMVAAAAFQLGDAVGGGVGWGPTLVGTAVSFVVAYASVVWLVRFVAHHSIVVFAIYRVAVAGVLVIGLATGAIASV